MRLLFFVISFAASMVGAICGIGGGVIIKPVLDVAGALNVSTINFLSGCTVLSMSLISVLKILRQKEKEIDLRTATTLVTGASAGGIAGKNLFQYILRSTSNENITGTIQAAILCIITLGTLVYMLYRDKVRTLHIKSFLISITIGFLLGCVSSFLGIGGGPINLIVLGYFFSMGTKEAAANSLYIILFSQGFSFLNTVINRNIPKVDLLILVLMVLGGVTGGILGRKINKKITNEIVDKLLIAVMIIIILISAFNTYRLSGI